MFGQKTGTEGCGQGVPARPCRPRAAHGGLDARASHGQSREGRSHLPADTGQQSTHKAQCSLELDLAEISPTGP